VSRRGRPQWVASSEVRTMSSHSSSARFASAALFFSSRGLDADPASMLELLETMPAQLPSAQVGALWIPPGKKIPEMPSDDT
jgi:hypothetical protein